MDIEIDLSGKREYTASVENVSIRLLINDLYKSISGNPLSTLNIQHIHLYTELFVCTSGEINIETDSQSITLKRGDAAIIPAKMPHQKLDRQLIEGWRSIGFFITKKNSAEYSNLHKKLKPLCLSKEPILFHDIPEICERIDALHKTIYKENDCLPAIELTCVLSKLATIATKDNTKDVPKTRMPDIYRIAWFEDLIANCYYEPLTTGKVATMLHISTRHLSRIIKEQYGTTFHKFLIKKRLDIASKLLITTNNSVNSILRKTGYSKSSSFYKDFSERFGVTPTEYREKRGKI